MQSYHPRVMHFQGFHEVSSSLTASHQNFLGVKHIWINMKVCYTYKYYWELPVDSNCI